MVSKYMWDIKESRRAWLFLGVALVPLMVATPALATDDAEDLDDVVVSANRVETPISQVGSSVVVITADEIEKKQASTAMDVLDEVPGLNIFTNGGPGKNTGIFMRGVGYKNILILIDGVEVADPSGTQTTYDLTHLMADNIERVEVLKGNQSTLYGSDAIGGVISITTKSGKGSGKLYTGSAGVEIGSYTTRKAYANVRGEVGQIYYNTALTGFGTEGWDISAKRDDDVEQDGYNNISADLKFGADIVKNVGVLDKLNVEAGLRWLKGYVEFDAWGPTDGDEAYRKTERGVNTAIKADMFDGVLKNKFAVSYAQNRRDYENTTYPYYDGNKAKYEYEGVLTPLENHTFVYGIEQERENMATYSTSRKDLLNTGYYLNYQLGLLDKDLTVTMGVRQDEHDTFGNQATYRGTVGYMLDETNTRFHASYGTGFRAPSLYELYDPTWGNADLEPEKSRGYDVGVEQSLFDDRLVVDVTYFNQRLTNEIAWSAGYNNVSSSRAFGLETTVDAELTDEWSISGSHTYQQARDNSTGTASATRPHHMADIRVDYSPEWMSDMRLWTKARFATWSYDSNANKEYVGGYSVYDIGGDYKLNEWASVYGRVENLLDKDYYTKGEYEESGIAGYIGIRAKF